MFDIGFSEMMLIAVVALIVIGPERLPRVARTMGHLFGRLQRYVNDVKADINREIELDELRKFKSEFEQAAQSVQADVSTGMQNIESSIDSVAKDLGSLPGDAPAAPALPENGAVPAAAPEKLAGESASRAGETKPTA